MDTRELYSKDFERLYINYSPRMCAYALRFVTDKAEVQDIVHDCFISLWNRKSFLSEEESAALLFVMLRNHCVDYLRHKNVVDKYTLHYVAKIKGEERLYNYDFSYNNSEHPFLYQELEKQIQNVIDRLPERCREIFLMSRIDGLKNREIAAKLQISTQAVEKHIGKAIRILSEQLEKNDSIYLRIIILSLIISSGA